LVLQRKTIELKSVDIHLLYFSDFEASMYLDCLTDDELERYPTFLNNQRKKEFVATRFLRTELVGLKHINYDSVGAPFINDSDFISISHSKNIVGIAISKEFKIGLDIEYAQSKINAIKHKFLHESELESFDCNSEIELTKIWTAKEVLYKIAGKKGINFRTELVLNKMSQEKWRGTIKSETDSCSASFSTEINIFEIDTIIIAINTKKLE